MSDEKDDGATRGKIAIEITKARDCLNRARDGIPEQIWDAGQLRYPFEQIDKALVCAAKAKEHLEALRVGLIAKLEECKDTSAKPEKVYKPKPVPAMTGMPEPIKNPRPHS